MLCIQYTGCPKKLGLVVNTFLFWNYEGARLKKIPVLESLECKDLNFLI